MPASFPRHAAARLPLLVVLGLVPLASLALPACGRAPVCGDARLDEELGEECDDGNLVDTDECTNACKLPACGDGITSPAAGEECDDGNDDGTDKCTNECREPVCGDGFVEVGKEECDDGNLSNTDDCLQNCLEATCGDGFVRISTTSDPPGPLEECDDANADSTDDCTNLCKNPACGDGFVWAGVEQCDDGNTEDDDGCPSTCLLPVCGDGFVNPATEECDDGNLVDTDGCLSNCKAAKCGDGVVQAGAEECDDGNGVSGDFCSPACQKECFGANAGLFGGSCYMYFPGPLTWAEANCSAFGAHLVTIFSPEENTFVRDLVPDQSAWIGFTDQAVESVWVWQLDPAGQQVLFPAVVSWGQGQPDDQPAPGADCGVIEKASGLWFDEPCTDTRGFVCEYEFPE